MAYHHADDTFLPSWGSGMRPREPIDAGEESASDLHDFAPMKKPAMQPEQPVVETQMDQPSDPIVETQMDPPSDYGTMPEMIYQYDKNDKIFASKTRRLERVRMAEKSLFLLWWPAFLGTCIVAVYSLKYWHHPVLAHSVLALSIAIASVMFLIAGNGGWSGKASSTFMAVNGFFILSVALLAAALGVYGFQTHMKSYEIYSASQFYDKVAPNINPGAHRDGGVIEFAAGSHVDVEHSIGVKNGEWYCAAPIMFPDSNGFSGFWAAGLNCCNARGGFSCGDVANPLVRSGLVVLDENMFEPGEIPQYTRAAQQAAAQFGIAIPSQPMFVKWSGDAEADKTQYYLDATGFVRSCAEGLFLFMLATAIIISAMAMVFNDGFAHDYYSVEVESMPEQAPDYGIAENPKGRRRVKKSRLARDPGDNL